MAVPSAKHWGGLWGLVGLAACGNPLMGGGSGGALTAKGGAGVTGVTSASSTVCAA